MFRRMQRRRGSAASVILVILILALVAGGVWYFVLRSTPKKTVTAMLDAARTGGEALVMDYLTERSRGREQMVVTMTRRLAGTGTGEPEYTIGDATTGENTATVPVEFPLGSTVSTLTGRETITIPYVLHREERMWLVDTPDTQTEAARKLAGGLFDALKRFFLPHARGDAPADSGDRRI